MKILCALLLCSSTVFAFQFRRSAETLPEQGTIVMCILEEPKAHYAFRPPYDWDTLYDEQSKTVTMAPKKDPKSWITIRLASSTNSPAAGIKAYLRLAYPKGEFVEQFTLHTSSQEAESADFTDASASIPLKRRIALVPSPSGTFEFLLSSRPDDFGPGEQVFGQVMGSFEFRAPPEKTGAAQ